MRNFLVYTSAGDNANVRLWAKKADRSYDIWITNYSVIPGLNREYADFYNESQGAKFPNFQSVLEQNRKHLSAYQAIMIADDDIILSCADIDALFRLLIAQDVGVVVPALSRFGKVFHDTTARELRSDFRITNFAEVTCPIIRIDLLLDFMNVYDSSSVQCHGLDWWYLNHWGDKVKDKILISDTHYCINPRDWFKKDGQREIDRYYSEAQRQARWKKQQQKLHIHSFPKVISGAKPKALGQYLSHAPLFYIECMFAFVLDKLLPLLVHPIKRLIKRFAKQP